MPLRNYQQNQVDDLRNRFRAGDRSVCVQLATGGGKTPEVAEIIDLARAKNPAVRAWFVVPRNKLLDQGSDTFRQWGIAHGRIDATHQESNAFNIHVVSKDTLTRRLDKINNSPDLIIFDEAHLYFDAQQRIIKRLPSHTRIVGFTATPERLDGKALSDIYQTIVYGPPIVALTELGHLAPIRYFAPVLDWADKIKWKGKDADEESLEQIFAERKIYGDVLKYYRQYAAGKSTMVFCRSIKSAERTADRFREAGFNFEAIEGNMSQKKQRVLIGALSARELDGLTSCELATYGVDIPGLEVAVHLRPTQSRALFYQINGRVMRPDTEQALIIDHVNNIRIHGHPYHEKDWNFDGTVIRRAKKSCEVCKFADAEDSVLNCRRFDLMLYGQELITAAENCEYFSRAQQKALALCPSCWHYSEEEPCPNCGEDSRKGRKDLEEQDAELVEQIGPVKLAKRPRNEAKEIEQKISALTVRFRESLVFDEDAVSDMVEIATDTKRSAMWVYHALNRTGKTMVHVQLLYAIQKAKGYSKGWAWRMQGELNGRVRK